MSLFGILAVLAIIAAIPTFGLSFVALFFAKKWINSNEGKKIAAAAINARQNDKVFAIPFVSGAGTRSFFNTFGSLEKKFERFEKPTLSYIGFVKVENSDEYVVMVNSEGVNTYVTTFETPRKFGDDLLSLLAKEQFLETIHQGMKT